MYETRDGLQILERLDRALATVEWVNFFLMARLYHLTSAASDHSPLALHFLQRIRERRRKHLFRFESMWLKDPKCEEVVLEAWEEGLVVSTGFPLTLCLERCKLHLEAWNKGEFGQVGRKIAELQKHLEWLELQLVSPSIIGEMRKTRIELNCWHEKEDAMWYQRSRINWYQFGDRNTSYFHAKASARQKKNYMEGLMDDNGQWHIEENKMGELVINYYTDLFSSSNPLEFAELLQAVQPKVTTKMNHRLTMDFFGEEVWMALKQMYPLMALGPDGMPPYSISISSRT